jgi:hypothetical protein
MYCLPLDDACQLEKFQHTVLRKAAEDFAIDSRTFSLGTFNGRVYTYTWLGKTPVIFIDDAGKPLSDSANMLGGD